MRRAFAALALATVALPVAAAPPSPAGRWLATGGGAIVDVAPCRAGAEPLCGRLATLLHVKPGAAPTDRNNPDPSLRARPIQGLVILHEFRADGDHWAGSIYDPRSGRSYRSELRREGGTLKVKGCWGIFCRTQEWTRAG